MIAWALLWQVSIRAQAGSGRAGMVNSRWTCPGAIVHADHFAAAVADQFHYAAANFFGDIDDEIFDGFEDFAVGIFAHDDVGFADAEFISFVCMFSIRIPGAAIRGRRP